MYIKDILTILPIRTPTDTIVHKTLKYLLSFNITYIQFVHNKDPFKLPLKQIKHLIYQKYIDSLQYSTEYSEEYYATYTSNMETFHHIKHCQNYIKKNYLVSRLLQKIPTGPSTKTHSYIATYQ